MSERSVAITTLTFDKWAWTAAVLSMLGLIITLAGSSIGALLFLASWGLVVAPRADRCLQVVFRAPELWAIPVLATVSVLWTAAPGVTGRAAVQLLATVGIASLTAAFLKPRALVSAMSVSLLCGAVLSLAFGRYGVDGMTGATVFLGIFAGKNTMALFMSFLTIFATAVLADRGQPVVLRALAVVSCLLSLPLLILARSAGAAVTTAASMGVLLCILVFSRLRPQERLLLSTAIAAVMLPFAAVIGVLAVNGTLEESASTFLIQVLGKDATLTGRTVLWEIALVEIAKRPWFGVGYYGFWLQGNLLAESIWRHFSIESRMGFHFHNTYLEFAVELGWVGCGLLLVTFILAIARAIRQALGERSWAAACLVAVMFCLGLRTVGEVDAPYPFSAGTFLFFVVAAYGADYVRSVRVSPRFVSRPSAEPASARFGRRVAPSSTT